MPTFSYEAKDGPARKVTGVIEAATMEEAVEKISALGYTPLKLGELQGAAKHKESAPARQKAPSIPVSLMFSAMPRSRDVTIFSQQLASLIKSGVPIIKGLRVISEQSENNIMKVVLGNIAELISQGETFSGALEKFPKIFPKLYVSMVRAGENSGQLHQILTRIAEYRRKSEESAAKTRVAMVYPALMGLVGLGTIIFMLVFVMPRIIKLFEQLGQDLPTPTKVVIWVSVMLRTQWVFVLMGSMALILVLKQFFKTTAWKKMVSVMSLNIPAVKHFVLMTEIARFSRTMELLVKSGIPVLKTLELSIPTIENEIMKEKLWQCYKRLEQGSTFGGSLQEHKIFPPFMVNLIIVSEEAGHFEEAFDEIAATYERETDESLKVLMSFLEPMMILGMGLVVGFVVIAMLLPIFEINMMAK